MLPHLIGGQEFFILLPTGILCHFWRKLMAGA
jgi:hypothetical protein